MILLKTPFHYDKVEKADPEEARHKKAQFLIYKVLEESNSLTRKPAIARRVHNVKARIGVRMKKLGLAVRNIRLSIYRSMKKHLKNLNRTLHGKQESPPP